MHDPPPFRNQPRPTKLNAQDLMNIMFDESFPVAKQELPVSLNQSNVIFVFEDVDAASKIVQARRNTNTNTNSAGGVGDAGDVGASVRQPKGRGRSKGGNKTTKGTTKSGQQTDGGKDKARGKGRNKGRGGGIARGAKENKVKKSGRGSVERELHK